MIPPKRAKSPWEINAPYGLMGIVNATPDSFFDGGRSVEEGIGHACMLAAQGASILDLGAESTRPGALPVAPEEEVSRLAPYMDILLAQGFPPLSIDTRNAATAAWAAGQGAAIINDVSGLRHDPEMISVLASCQTGFVLTHSVGEPRTMQLNPVYNDVVEDIKRFFEAGLNKLAKAGVSENRIALDPGIGFGKTREHNLEIMRNIKSFREFGRPLLIGLSMKSILGQITGSGITKRGPLTAVATALMWREGVTWHRVHDVEGARCALELAIAFSSSPACQRSR